LAHLMVVHTPEELELLWLVEGVLDFAHTTTSDQSLGGNK